MGFTEEKLEKAFIELLREEGFEYVSGKDLNRDNDEVLIIEDLKEFLKLKYQDEGITVNEINSVIRDLKNYPASDLYESNKNIMKRLSDGFVLKREDRNKKDLYVHLIDYSIESEIGIVDSTNNDLLIAADPEVEYGKNDVQNIYKVVNQLEIQGYEKRIPDVIVYINGIPLVVLEFKSAVREEATIHDAFVQLTTRYKRDIPELFKYNAFCVISDGVNNKAGSFFAPYEFFYAWRRIAGMENEVDGIDSLYSMIQGMFQKSRLCDIIHNFVYLPDTSSKDEKIICRYPQYYAARKLFESIKNHQKPDGDGKGGTYFGATGCGKSYTMLFLSRLIMKSVYFSSPTIVLITDRTDLDDQLSAQFTNAKGFIGDNNRGVILLSRNSSDVF